MKTYTLNRPVFIESGTRLRLTEAQAACRSRNITDLGDGVYRADAILNFKSGETLGIEPLARYLESAVTLIPSADDAAAEASAAPRVRAGRKASASVSAGKDA